MSKIEQRKSIMGEFADIEREVEYIKALQRNDVHVGLNDLPAQKEEFEEDVHPDEAAFYQDALYHRHA